MSTDDCASVKQRAKESKAKFLVELQLSLTNTILIVVILLITGSGCITKKMNEMKWLPAPDTTAGNSA